MAGLRGGQPRQKKNKVAQTFTLTTWFGCLSSHHARKARNSETELSSETLLGRDRLVAPAPVANAEEQDRHLDCWDVYQIPTEG